MALTELTTNDLVPRLFDGARIAAMGYPDIVAPEQKVLRWLGTRECEYRNDAAEICRWHGLKKQRIPDAKSFFAAFGCSLTVFDIAEIRGGEVLCDLNESDGFIPGSLTKETVIAYDFVLDVGTIEHCFNIGQAALNMASLLKAGGIIYHGNPFYMPNHGFYSLNPTWFADFYGQPGFDLLWCKTLLKGGTEPIEVPLTKRFNMDTAQEMNIFAAARRTELRAISTSIMQTKYAALAAAGKPGVGDKNG